MTTALPYIDADEFARLLPMPAAIDALDATFATADPDDPPRSHVGIPDGDLLLMPAASADGVGVKLVTVTPGNPGRDLPLIQGLYVLFAPGTNAPLLMIDGAAMTALRTAAVSGVATRHLARPDSARLVVIGAGTQARSHVTAMRAVRPIEHVTVISRTEASARSLVDALRAESIDATVGQPAAIRDADVICTCTTSDEPVVAGAQLAPGVHVNAVGAYRPDARELDTTVLRRGRIVVEQRAAALEEAGDLCIPIADGALTADDIVADLRQVVSGAEVRRDDDDITVFKSVGLAMEDLAIAVAVARRAERH
ncbi:MAG: ornithine cyclodeaminase family protein [Actinobacteria bacterium]|nr:ornithine cyclodeaminase family protein [Actinomycetota bacterium]